MYRVQGDGIDVEDDAAVLVFFVGNAFCEKGFKKWNGGYDVVRDLKWDALRDDHAALVWIEVAVR